MSVLTNPSLNPNNNLSDLTNKHLARKNQGVGGVWVPEDHGMIAWAYDPTMAVNSSTLAVVGTLYGIRLKLDAPTTITNIFMFIATGGTILVGGQNFAALYQNDTLLDVTADQSTPWASSGLKTMALNTPQVVTAGEITICLWSNGSTTPTFVRSGGQTLLNSLNLTAANSRFFSTNNTGLTTTAPGTLGTKTALNAAFWASVN